MNNGLKLVIAILLVQLVIAPGIALAGRFWQLPPLPPPDQYGDLLLDRRSSSHQVKSVYFSHWSHRTRYTCRVCHWELDFSFKTGETDITEEDNRNGLYCGACHNGKIAFGHQDENCQRCHTGKISPDAKKFNQLRQDLPRGSFGNRVNWTLATMTEKLSPIASIIRQEEKPMAYGKKLLLQAAWAYVPAAVFPHDIHSRLLDCSSCHPDIFNIKKKGTENFQMNYILEGRFCGVCHLTVAFPMDDCHRCHPGIKNE
ncbi:MAG: hypothetical protein HGB26_02795 [Desulfobulbaceae bacterium]|nr:hypothetical protein [Desulfobulbaceae bacterium]